MSKRSGLGKFLAGAAIGGALGVLFAPKSGSESRDDLKNKSKEVVDKIKNADYEEIKKNVETRFEQLKKEAKDLDKEKALKIAKEKAQDIKQKACEVADYAYDYAAPVVQKYATKTKQSIIDLLNSTIEKLEESNGENTNKKATKK